MELSWFVFSLSATILLGIGIALYKVPSFKKESRFVTTFWVMVIPFILSLIFFNQYLSLSSFGMVIIALLWGVSFSLLVTLQMYALKKIDTNALFPVTSTLSLVIAVILGFLLFKEIISLLQFFGIVLVIILVYFYLYKKKKLQYSKEFLFAGLGIIFFSVLNKIIQKIIANNYDIHAYQIFQYFWAAIFSFLIILYFHKKDFKKYFSKTSFLSGGLIGLFSFFGGYALLTALTKGPFTLIMAIHSIYIFVTALTGALLFKEKLSKKIILLLILAILALIIIRIG